MRIGEKIKKLRELRNFTQEYMAEKLAISQNAYSKIERNETDVSYSRVESVAKILDVDVLDIIGFDEKKLLFNISDNKDQSHNGLIIHTGLSDKEKTLYEQMVSTLKLENEFLKRIVESYIK
jgi:transcriptional regulator with XRE-family HTH domain